MGHKKNLLTESYFKKTTEMLELNPEHYTVWNYRRDIIEGHYKQSLTLKELSDTFKRELRFTLVQMKRYPKVYCIWNYRSWLLENDPEPDWDNELAIVDKLLTMDSRNFHGWQYRRYVIGNLERVKGESLALQEFEYTTKMINKNISNFSAWHNRTKLIPLLFELQPTDLFKCRLKFLQNELNYLQNAMYTDPEDQSVWIYLRWVLTSDIFIKDIDRETYLKLLDEQLQIIKDLNELEKDDNGIDNNWCLKSIVTIESLIAKFYKDDVKYHDEIKASLQKLIEADPLRKNRYIEISSNF